MAARRGCYPKVAGLVVVPAKGLDGSYQKEDPARLDNSFKSVGDTGLEIVLLGDLKRVI